MSRDRCDSDRHTRIEEFQIGVDSFLFEIAAVFGEKQRSGCRRDAGGRSRADRGLEAVVNKQKHHDEHKGKQRLCSKYFQITSIPPCRSLQVVSIISRLGIQEKSQTMAFTFRDLRKTGWTQIHGTVSRRPVFLTANPCAVIVYAEDPPWNLIFGGPELEGLRAISTCTHFGLAASDHCGYRPKRPAKDGKRV
jgi:hypothetical protein